MTPGLHAQGLGQVYGGRRVLDRVDLSVLPGEVHGLLGPNGAGKTSTFRILAGVEAAEGTVVLDGLRLDGLPLYRRARLGLGYLPQEETLLRDLNVHDNVALAVQVAGSGLKPDELLEQVGIAPLAGRRVDGLSGGERRRLALARLLAIRPKVVLLDEPFAGVDPVAVHGFQTLVRQLAARGVAVLITDHAVRETLAICDRATVLDAGSIQVTGTPKEVAENPHARARYLGMDFRLS